MQISNETPFVAAAPRIDLGASGWVTAVIVKSTFELDPSGNLAVAHEQMPLVDPLLETPFGTFHAELFFKKQGVDLCVLGTVRRARPVSSAIVRLALGERRWSLRVSGDRRWLAAPGFLRTDAVASRPEPFTRLPLGYARAFGDPSDNPCGRGHYPRIDEALGQPLANIEAADVPTPERWRPGAQPIVGWGPYPSHWGLRTRASVQIDPNTGALARVSPALFNHAHPDLVLDRFVAGERLTLEGLHEQPIHCRIPAPPASVSVRIGDQQSELDAPIDGVFLWADARKLVITQRARFKYAFAPEQRRVVTIRANEEDSWSPCPS